jgi:hypothetical protein
MARALSAYEQETFITFNKAQDIAHILTYDKTWHKRLEKNFGLKPVTDNDFGDKEYELSKSRIKPPEVPRRLSDCATKKLAERLRRNRAHFSQKPSPCGKINNGKSKEGNSLHPKRFNANFKLRAEHEMVVALRQTVQSFQ